MYSILHYADLDYSGLKTKFDKTVTALANGDFKSADVKKMQNTGYYRAKLDETNRLLFCPIKYQDKTYLLMLEVIKNHHYEKSRFLSGAVIDEEKFIDVAHVSDSEISDGYALKYLREGRSVHLLDKFIIFDDDQTSVMNYPLPLIIIGSAGSGKTSVTLEKLKHLTGHCLYISLSSYLVAHSRKTYYANNYDNEHQTVEFLSFSELLETIKIPAGNEINANVFMRWFASQLGSKLVKDGRKLYEEISGVITGSDASVPYLSKAQYLSLGVKQSIYLTEQKPAVYQYFEKYIKFLAETKQYDTNILATEYQTLITPIYDAIVIDEVQDFTNSQLALVLKALKLKGQFLLCGDANQIVHPNFFSWSKLKSYFYVGDDLDTQRITRILNKNIVIAGFA